MPFPFLKWPGGKRWIAAEISSLIRHDLRGTYYEPCLGGGAVFFQLQPAKAVLADINAELIDTYRAVRDTPIAVLRVLKGMAVNRTAYYRIRDAWRPRSTATRAARFLYLNRTAFGGIYRLNREGRFNVPYGDGTRCPSILWDRNLLSQAATTLLNADLRCCDFEPLLDEAVEGDVVYCDPTYTVAHDHNGFVRYNERNFSWADQQRLARAATRASRLGVTVIVSNARSPLVKALYPGAEAKIFTRTSRVSTDPKKRRTVSEYLLVLRPTIADAAPSLAPHRAHEAAPHSSCRALAGPHPHGTADTWRLRPGDTTQHD